MRTILLTLIVSFQISSIGAEGLVTITAVGDIRLDGYIAAKVHERGFDFPFKNVRDIFDLSDITYGNLECVLSLQGEPVEKAYVFCAEPEMVEVLTTAGFDIMDLANNHSGDYGTDAFIETMRVLRTNGISYTGAGMNIRESREPVLLKKNGLTVAFLSYSNTFPKSYWATKEKPGVTPAFLEYISHDVREACHQADSVIVCYHGGDERSDTPKQVQRDIAYTAINAGATMVLGHHPHVLQGIEVYKGKPVVYSLGNFLFLSKAKECYDTMIVRATVGRDGIQSLEIIPIRISDAFVRTALPKEAERILNTIKTLSGDLGTEIEINNDSAFVKLR